MIKVERLETEKEFQPIKVELTIKTLKELKEFMRGVGNTDENCGKELYNFLGKEVKKYECFQG